MNSIIVKGFCEFVELGVKAALLPACRDALVLLVFLLRLVAESGSMGDCCLHGGILQTRRVELL
ncbi:hypothetical protein [Corynebacterium pseudodiphtheriticum]|uniref:hypothetical protein n=1 Tax=Corynebacterium pseudodiphtheriticum TaxID=37637 RepID=UPI0025433330|nr:hypothetical protein [Corynebacterium pseudodiphtheriticum]MDK4317424.1 hypothetical protein [Corynebacterium pseudodiphtheriticum]